jgi:WD40 repeat protein
MNERDVFIEALQIESRAERQAYLDASCGGDETLRRQVEALLETHDRAGSFLEEPLRNPVEAAAALFDHPAGSQPSDTDSSRTVPPRGQSPETQGEVTEPMPPSLEFLAPAAGPGEIGRLGGYRVLKVLGTGGMGVVFHAEDTQLKRAVALKAMLPHLAVSPSARQRFLQEAQATAAIEHDHIVPIYCVGEDRGVPFLAMPLLKGEALDVRLRRESQLPLAEVLRIGREVAEGLAAAHERGLIHRDVKPGNLWLEGERGRVKVLDFGLARAAGGDSHLTQQGAILGTPAYMAPEQANGRPLDARCDLFALGAVLYRIATGEPPFKGTDPISTMMAVATVQPREPRELNPSLPPALNKLILRLLAKDAADRPASATEVARALLALEQETAGFAPSADKRPRPIDEENTTLLDRRAVPPSRRRRWLALVAGLGLAGLAIALLVAALIGAFHGRPDDGLASARAVPFVAATSLDGASNRRADGLDTATHRARLELPPIPPFTLSGHGSQIQALAFTADGKTLVSAEYFQGTVLFWDMDRRETTFQMAAVPGGQLECLALDPHQHWLAVGPMSAVGQVHPGIRLFHFGKPLLAGQLKGHTDRVSQLAFLKDGRTLLSTGFDGSIRRWDVVKQEEGKPLREHGPRLDCLNVYEDAQGGLRVALAGYASKVHPSTFVSLSIGNDAPDEVLERFSYGPGQAALSPDGKRLACSRQDRMVKPRDSNVALWSLPDKAPLGELSEAPQPVGLAFTPDGQHVVVAGATYTCIYETASGKAVARVDHPERAVSLAVSPDGRWLAIGTLKGPVRIWQLPSLLPPPG